VADTVSNTKHAGQHHDQTIKVQIKVSAYGRYAGAPSQADLERVFFLHDRTGRWSI